MSCNSCWTGSSGCTAVKDWSQKLTVPSLPWVLSARSSLFFLSSFSSVFFSRRISRGALVVSAWQYQRNKDSFQIVMKKKRKRGERENVEDPGPEESMLCWGIRIRREDHTVQHLAARRIGSMVVYSPISWLNQWMSELLILFYILWKINLFICLTDWVLNAFYRIGKCTESPLWSICYEMSICYEIQWKNCRGSCDLGLC